MRPRGALAAAALALVLAGGADRPAAPPPLPSTPSRAPADEAPQDEDLAPDDPLAGPLPAELASVLEAKAAGYARRALGFSCRERVREASYDNGGAGSEKVREHDFLLVRDATAPEGFRALRTKPGSTSGKEEHVDLTFPDPPLFSQIFTPHLRSTLRFEVGRWHTTPYRLAIPITWVSAAPVLDRHRITEWSGTVEVEYRTGNIVKIVAHPSLQDERMRPALERYLTAFRFAGLTAAQPPIGYELEVDFDFEHEGFTYPTRVELRTYQQMHRDERAIIARRVVEYGDYRFFGTAVHDVIPPLVWGAPPVGLPRPTARPGQ